MIVLAMLLAGQTTACQMVFNQLVCNTQQPPKSGVDWSLLNPPPAPAAPAFGPGVWEAQRQWEANNRRKKAGKMIAKGDCDGARAYALGKGDLALADQVTAACAR